MLCALVILVIFYICLALINFYSNFSHFSNSNYLFQLVPKAAFTYFI